MKSCAEGWYQ